MTPNKAKKKQNHCQALVYLSNKDPMKKAIKTPSKKLQRIPDEKSFSLFSLSKFCFKISIQEGIVALENKTKKAEAKMI